MFFIEILKSIILGIVQGITEWLPISSTGHMILVDEFIQLNASDSFKEMFFVVIQFASILAVILIYFQKLNPFSSIKTEAEKKDTWQIWLKVLVGVIPAGVIGLLFEDAINAYFYNWQTVSIALIVYGILFIIIEKRNKNRAPKIQSFADLDYKTALLIGFFQVLALIPGTSRSGATIVGAILIGTARPVAAEYSFFLSIPVMIGASALKLLGFGFSFTSTELVILLAGMIVSFLVSVVAIKFLMSYIRRNDFTAFGWYRIILGAIVIGYFAWMG
ncbi:undecaprenyl-diphosphate phosphatase [Atopococcus tabaci]|uniref:undecaprenyl-diphosphate phosphatase n=1 Tax=Atopococcus tabaci TaxID=269774 RepID=UPI00040CAEF2|nr:undecaprenyl-diphosphate phosphatase [Atopococcus tabaci]